MKAPSSKQPNLTKDTEKFVTALAADKNAKPLYELSYKEARNVLLSTQKKSKVSAPECEVIDEELMYNETDKVSVRIFKPQKSRGKLPLVMYFHGGGWVMGDKTTHDRLMKELAVGANVAMVFVNYTPSPEAQYPVPLEQDYAAMEYLIKNANKFNLDSSKLAVAGDSVGGNMAAAMTLMSKQRKGPKIKFQVLIYPVTDAGMNTPSYKEFADGPWLSKKAMQWFWDAYCPDTKKRKDILASPLLADPEDLKGLPPAFIITDENDVLRDEGEYYARNLIQSGVDAVSVRYNGTIHDFTMLNPLAKTTPAIVATRQIIDMLKYHLHEK